MLFSFCFYIAFYFFHISRLVSSWPCVDLTKVNSTHESIRHVVNSTRVELTTCRVDSKPLDTNLTLSGHIEKKQNRKLTLTLTHVFLTLTDTGGAVLTLMLGYRSYQNTLVKSEYYKLRFRPLLLILPPFSKVWVNFSIDIDNLVFGRTSLDWAIVACCFMLTFGFMLTAMVLWQLTVVTTKCQHKAACQYGPIKWSPAWFKMAYGA